MVPKPRMLIVDDDATALELVSHIIESFQIELECLQSSGAAADLINKKKFDAVFLDWMMPEMDGLELARRIRKSKSNHSVPIIMLTSNVEPDAMHHAFQAGVTFFLTKPVTVEKVKKLLKASRAMILAERRRSHRISVSLDVACGWEGKKVRAKSLNLSTSGIFLLVEQPPPEGSDITLNFRLPGEVRDVALSGNVVWVVEVKGAGVQFTKFRPSDQELLTAFVEKKLGVVPLENIF